MTFENRRSRKRAIAPAFAFIAVVQLGTAHAEETAGAVSTPRQLSNEEEAHIRTLVREGEEFFGKNQPALARERLLQAWAIRRSYDIASALGEVEQELGHPDKAATYFDHALRNFAPTQPEDVLVGLRAKLAEVKRQVSTLAISVNEAGAEISVDDLSAGTSPLAAPVFVMPGRHVVRARRGGVDAKTELTGMAGEEVPVSLELKHPSAVPTPVDRSPGPGPRRNSWVPYATGSVAAIGAAVWIGFWVASNKSRDDAAQYGADHGRNACAVGNAAIADCATTRDAYDRSRREATISRVGLGVAVAGSLTTLGYFLFWPRETSATGVRIWPTVGANASEGAVLLNGQF